MEHPDGRARRWLLVVAALALGMPGVGTAATPPAYEPPVGAGVSDAGDAAGDNGGDAGAVRWRVPPIGVWGSLQYEFRRDRGEERDTVTGNLVTLKIDAATYIWKPWLATVNGGFGVTIARSRLDDEGGSSRDRFITGRAQINFFPRSRFPFEAHVEVNDTRVDSTLAYLPPSRLTRIGFSQNYRPEDGRYLLTTTYDHWTQSGADVGADTQDAFTVSGESSWKDQRLALYGSWNLNRRERTGEEQEFDTLVARHSYLPSAEFSVESTANLTRNRYRLTSGANELGLAQLSSVGYWRPGARPLTVTGAVRLFGASVDGGSSTYGGNANLGATYVFTDNLRANANAAVGAVSTPGRTTMLHSEGAGLTYQGNTVKLASLNYDWYTGANVANAGASDGRNVAGVNADFGHTVGRAWTLGNASTFAATFGQNFAVGSTNAENGSFRDISRMSNSVAFTWSTGADVASAYARVSVSDSRRLFLRHDVFQIANLQISGTWDLGRYSSLAGDLTAQHTRQDSEPRQSVDSLGLPDPFFKSRATGVSANIAYRHQRVFGVPRLRFLSELRITDDSVVQQDAASLLPKRETRYWENRFDYAIGRLLVNLSLRISEFNGRRFDLLMFRIQRDFGGVAAW